MHTVREIEVIWQSWYNGSKVLAANQIERCIIKHD